MDSLTPESIALCTEILVCVLLLYGTFYFANCPRQSVQVCALVVVLWFLLSEGAESAIAAQMTPTTANGTAVTAPQTFPTVLKDGVQLPDWSKISFDSMNPFSEAGSVAIPSEFSGALGFDKVEWKAGQKIADALPMGAISDCLGANKLTQNQIDGITGQNSAATGLDAFLPVGLQNIRSLASAVPDLKNKLVGDVQPISDLVSKALSGSLPGFDLNSLQGLVGQVTGGAGQQILDSTGGLVGSLSKGKFLDTAGNLVGQVNGTGQVVDTAGQVMGTLNQTGQFVNSAGQVVGALSKPTGAVTQATTQAATQAVGQQLGQVTSGLGQTLNGINPQAVTIGQLTQQFPQLADLGLKNLDLSKYTMSQIPELGNAQLGNFQNWEQVLMKGVPGLSKVPLGKFPNPMAEAETPYIARVDVPLDKAEQDREKSLSGSYQEGFRVPCTQNCTHAELSPIEGSQMDAASAGAFANGKVWMNRDQQVKGGMGPLAKVNSGKEPTGRNPYCSAFKQVITVVDQPGGKVSTGMYFRVCKHGVPDLGCTPYFIGPIPFLTYAEKQFIYLGAANPKDDGGGINVNQDPLSGGDGFVPDCSATLSGDAVNKAIAVSRSLGGAGGSASGIGLILGAAKAQGITDVAQLSYMLATAEHETDHFQTMNEYASGSEYEGRDDLGNTQSGDGVRYKGRGFAQLTGRANYAKLGAILKVDLINNPNLAAQPDIAAKIFAYGMKNGAYTGQKMSDYINGNRVDWVGARYMVNSQDRAGLIAGYAQKYYDAIKDTIKDATATTTGNCGGGGAPLSGSLQQRIYQAAKNAYGESTSAGPDGGNNACAWEVSRLLKRAGVPGVAGSDGVVELTNQIRAAGGAKISASQAQPGDIVIAYDYHHVGICMNVGCSQVMSNSSSQAAFKWQSNVNFDGAYGGASEGVYRVKGS